MKIDLHIHSVYSDGCCSPEQIASRIKALGLSGFALTDHDSISGWTRAKKAARDLELTFIPGKEIVIREPIRPKEKKGRKVGEILALFLDEDIKIKKEEQNISNLHEIADQIHDRNGIIAVPHPFSIFFRTQKIIYYLAKNKIKFDAIETMNGRCNAFENAKSMDYASEYKIPQIGGSDAHTFREIGTVYTFADANNIEDYRKAIKKGFGKPIGIQKGNIEINLNRLNGRIIRFLK
ncbi:MAG: PHP domain-containing protein [Candidatus Micrarchaeota archaeon]|nr:PHP domain-containing protein [Candidatus Micrarchaeota archaeon]